MTTAEAAATFDVRSFTPLQPKGAPPMRRLVVVSSVLLALLLPGAAHAWSWPVDGPVLRPFAFGSDPYAGGQHRGIDIGAGVGSRVAAPVGGVVSFVGSVPNGGRAITIRTDDGYAVTLLQLGDTAVARGGKVSEGETLGAVGESADAVTREPHLHLGVRVASDDDGYVDPLTFLPRRSESPAPAPEPAPEAIGVPVAPAAMSAPAAAVTSEAPAASPPAPATPAVAPAPAQSVAAVAAAPSAPAATTHATSSEAEQPLEIVGGVEATSAGAVGLAVGARGASVPPSEPGPRGTAPATVGRSVPPA